MVLKNEKKDEKSVFRMQILLNLHTWNIVKKKTEV